MPRWSRGKAGGASCIAINIDNHVASKTYTTGSSISGNVKVQPTTDLPFSAVGIHFQGMVGTTMNTQLSAGVVLQPFLRMRMNINDSDFPDGRIFKAGREYVFPFRFVIPSRILKPLCGDKCDLVLEEHHTRLPPSIGSWGMDDGAPETLKVNYAVTVRIVPDNAHPDLARPIDKYININVLPIVPEQAPVYLSDQCKSFRCTRGKKIRKNLISHSQGYLKATAIQPDPVMVNMSAPGNLQSSIQLDLEFTSGSGDKAPPEVHDLKAELSASTHSAITHVNYLPLLQDAPIHQVAPVLVYNKKRKVDMSKPAGVQWREPARAKTIRASRDANMSSDDEESSAPRVASSETGRKTYNATVVVPFRIPASDKTVMLPSFHSCYISRTYTLHLSLSMGSAGTALSLAVPLQVGVKLRDVSTMDELPTYGDLYQDDDNSLPFYSAAR